MRADCTPCKKAAMERVACPSTGRLAMDVRDAMLERAPSGVAWTSPSVDMCIPIGLPYPGWFVIGAVQQDTPSREFWFHLAFDARASKVVAISEPDQRTYNYFCETKFGEVVDSATTPSKVRMHVTCFDKMGGSTARNLEAEVVPPKVVLHVRD
ncbi:MAG: hypothetical protein KF773_03485 [Deltaproteobacteria bacterium]|nr:hypothetical protein [Deltaproteobacteria bacterium]